MAIGIALLLGFRFPMNFNSPYKADSITDFGIVGISLYLLGCVIICIFHWAVTAKENTHLY